MFSMRSIRAYNRGEAARAIRYDNSANYLDREAIERRVLEGAVENGS